MNVASKALNGSRFWYLAMMVIILACSPASGTPNQGNPLAATEVASPQQVPVRGTLVFSRRAKLTFDVSGEVEEILVREGDPVKAGQVLATLDPTTTASLERAMESARFDLDQAQEDLEKALKQSFINSPLQEAEFRERVAKAKKELEDAQEKLADFQRDSQRALAEAKESQANAQALVDDANEKREDFLLDYDDILAAAMMAKVDAELARDDAVDSLRYNGRDQARDLADARKELSDAEIALDKAREDLADFNESYQENLANARLEVAKAEQSLETAEDHKTTLIVGRPFDFPDEDDEGDDPVDELRRLRTLVKEADTNLAQSRTELAELEGNRSLLLQERQATVDKAASDVEEAQDEVEEQEDYINKRRELQKRLAAAEVADAELARANKDLEEELEGPDLIVLGQLEAKVETAKARLVQAEIDLAEEMEGPDQAELAVREKAVDLALEKLNDLIRPDPFEVALRKAEVTLSQTKLDDALEDLEGAVIRAPFDGIVSQVNLQVDDIVNDESRVLEVVDPTKVEVDGLLDAADVDFVQEGARALVTIDALGGQVLDGRVSYIAAEPRTESGTVSYPVTVVIEVPRRVEIPVGLSAVSTVVILQ